MKNTTRSSNGTSFYNDTFHASVTDLRQIVAMSLPSMIGKNTVY